MMVFISILIWITYSTFAIAIFDLDKKDPVTKKIIWPKTKKEYFKIWTGILSISGLAVFLIFMHDYHEDLLGQIYTYIGIGVVILWGIAIIFFGANPRRR